MRVRFEDPLELFAAEKKVRSLLDHPGWAVLTELVETRRNALVEQMGAADVLDHARYVAKANSVRTFDEVIQAPRVLLYIAAEVRRREEQEVEARGAGGQEHGRV